MMAKEYIERNELIENLQKFAPEHYNALINQLITKQPTADVKEVKHGEWERIIRNGKPRGIKCSLCGKHIHFHENYCPNCGAKMDGGKAE